MMMPWEREIHLIMLMQALQEEEEAKKGKRITVGCFKTEEEAKKANGNTNA